MLGYVLVGFLVNLSGDTIDHDRPGVIAVRLPHLAIGQGAAPEPVRQYQDKR
jgi:hypothetical protein